MGRFCVGLVFVGEPAARRRQQAGEQHNTMADASFRAFSRWGKPMSYPFDTERGRKFGPRSGEGRDQQGGVAIA